MTRRFQSRTWSNELAYPWSWLSAWSEMPELLDCALLTLDRLDREDEALSVRLAVLRVMRCSDVRRPDMDSSVCGRKRGAGRCSAAVGCVVVDDEVGACVEEAGGPIVRGLVGGDSIVLDGAVAR